MHIFARTNLFSLLYSFGQFMRSFWMFYKKTYIVSKKKKCLLHFRRKLPKPKTKIIHSEEISYILSKKNFFLIFWGIGLSGPKLKKFLIFFLFFLKINLYI